MEPVKKKQPAYMEALKYLSMLNPSTAVPAGLKMLVDQARENLASNIRPSAYGTSESSPESRVLNAMFGNPEAGSMSDIESVMRERGYDVNDFAGSFEKLVADEFGEGTDAYNFLIDTQKERQDLYQMYFGKDPKMGSIPQSEYRPSNSGEGDVFYRSPVTERNLSDLITMAYYNKANPLEYISNEIKNPGRIGAEQYRGPRVLDKSPDVLGNFTSKLGEDEKGTYIDYYDVYDLNPFSDTRYSGFMNKGSGFVGALGEEITKRLESIGEKAIGATPAKIYGRIYFDPETGEIQR